MELYELQHQFESSIFLKNRHFIIQIRFNKLMYGLNTSIKSSIWQSVKYQLVSLFWIGSKMNVFIVVNECWQHQFRDKIKIISFLIQFRNERQTEIFRLSDATFYDCINTIYQLIKSFLDNKMSVFEEYGAFKGTWQPQDCLGYFYQGRPICDCLF